MIVANFFHIKASNGLFFYGLDYANENLAHVRKALVRPALEDAARRALPGCEIVVCDGKRFLREAWRAQRRGDFLFTPTSHPLPGITRQWIVVHDAYPFVIGWRGAAKRALLRLSLALSRCRVAYINRADARPFIEQLGVSARRQVFAPNRFPTPHALQPRVRATGEPMSVGLVGTDSEKKNYAQLFAALAAVDPHAPLTFRFYGHDSAYFRAVCTQFPRMRLLLVPSDQFSLEQFFEEVDVIASAATQEGFGRPIAAALLAGIPCFLIECGVFREFFEGGALFRADVPALAQALVQATREPPPRPQFAPPSDVLAAYASANAALASLGPSRH